MKPWNVVRLSYQKTSKGIETCSGATQKVILRVKKGHCSAKWDLKNLLKFTILSVYWKLLFNWMLDVGNTFDLNEQKWQFWVGSRAKKIPQLPWSFSPSMSFYLCHQLYWIEQSRHTGFILPCYSHILFKVACIWILMQQQSSRGKCKGSSVFFGEKNLDLKTTVTLQAFQP